MIFHNDESSEVSLYVHIPFCASKCDYCDFTSFPIAQTADNVDGYFDALCRELDFWLERYSSQMSFKTIYIGGGTPSTISPESYSEFFKRVTPRISANCEFTCEVNPGSVDESFLEFMHTSGCNRISMGLQSPSNQTLCEINRHQTIEEFVEKYEMIRKFYDNVNMDFICGLPEQLEDWLNESKKIVFSLQPEHVSVYILEAEKETPLSLKLDKGEVVLPSMQFATTIFEEFAWFLNTLGYKRYEISNFSKSGSASSHNRVYWDYGQYIGLGVSAGGHVHNTRYVNTSLLDDYIANSKGDKRYEFCEEKTLTENLREMIFMGLRYKEGFKKRTLFDRIMNDFDEVVYQRLETLLFLMDSSVYFIVKDDKIRLNDYYFIHNREAFEFFIEVFEKLFFT